MTRGRRAFLLVIDAVVAASLLVAFLANRQLARDTTPADGINGLGRWIANHPADFLAASAMAEGALDWDTTRRFELWRAAYAHALRLAPRRPHATSAFVRGGLFHWYELAPPDREAVLRAAAPMLRDPSTFGRMHQRLWNLTGDFVYLRRNAPNAETSLASLRDLAAMHGRFEDYRELRAAIDRTRLQTVETRQATLTPPELIALLPPRLTRSDEPLVRRVLEELQRRPLDAGNAATARARADDLVAFAIRHGLRPLEGLEAMIETPAINPVTRARLAVALGRDRQASDIELVAATDPDQWIDYYLERAAFESARGNTAMTERYRLEASAARPPSTESFGRWSGTCGKNEVCTAAVTKVKTSRPGEAIVVDAQNAQSDEVPPYVEIYIDDARVAEAAVAERQVFRVVAPSAGIHRVEVRIANPRTRTRIQRRVRLS